MTLEEQAQYLEEGRSLQVASNGPRGYPHLVAMWYVVDDGDIVFTTFAKSQKVLNLQRDPKITCMLESGVGYAELRGLVIEGDALVIVDDADLTAHYMAQVRVKHSGDPTKAVPDEAQLKAATKRAVVRIKPKRVYSWDHSKLGGLY